MEGSFSVSSLEKSMASSTTTTTTVSTEDSERRDSNCYFPDCSKDTNCSCEICLDSLNAMLDLMPLSVQKSSLTKLTYASNNKFTVESTPTSFDPAVVTTPASVSRPISRVISPLLIADSWIIPYQILLEFDHRNIRPSNREGKFGYTKHNTSTSWKKTKLSTTLQQLDPNTWVLEYTRSSVIDDSSLLSLKMDLLKHMMFQVAKNANWEPYWMFLSSKILYREAETKTSTMTPT